MTMELRSRRPAVTYEAQILHRRTGDVDSWRAVVWQLDGTHRTFVALDPIRQPSRQHAINMAMMLAARHRDLPSHVWGDPEGDPVTLVLPPVDD